MANTFKQQLAEAASEIEKRYAAVTNDVVTEVAKRLIARTPVETGHLRQNWQLGIDEVPQDEVSGADPTGQSTLNRIQIGLRATLDKKADRHFFYLVNNTSYAHIIEYGGYPNPAKTGHKTVNGFSTQAPAGMVGITSAEFPEIVANAKANAGKNL